MLYVGGAGSDFSHACRPRLPRKRPKNSTFLSENGNKRPIRAFLPLPQHPALADLALRGEVTSIRSFNSRLFSREIFSGGDNASGSDSIRFEAETGRRSCSDHPDVERGGGRLEEACGEVSYWSVIGGEVGNLAFTVRFDSFEAYGHSMAAIVHRSGNHGMASKKTQSWPIRMGAVEYCNRTGDLTTSAANLRFRALWLRNRCEGMPYQINSTAIRATANGAAATRYGRDW